MGKTESTASRRLLWGVLGLSVWGVSTLAVVAAYDRFMRVESPPSQVVKHVHERPVIRVEARSAEAEQAVRPKDDQLPAEAATLAPVEPALDDRNEDPELREIERRERFDRILREFEAEPASGTERSRQTLVQAAIDRGLEGLPAAALVRRGDVECRGHACSMTVAFSPESDFPSFDAAIKQATSSDAVRDEWSGKRPLRALHTYKDGGEVVGRYFFRWSTQ